MKREYHLTMNGYDVTMSLAEFIELAAELEAMGVKIDIVAASDREMNKALVFKVDRRVVVGGRA